MKKAEWRLYARHRRNRTGATAHAFVEGRETSLCGCVRRFPDDAVDPAISYRCKTCARIEGLNEKAH